MDKLAGACVLAYVRKGSTAVIQRDRRLRSL